MTHHLLSRGRARDVTRLRLILVLSIFRVPYIQRGPAIIIMSNDSDPLLSLKQSLKPKRPLGYKKGSTTVTSFSQATHLVLSPTLSLPKSTPTRLRKPGATSTDPNANPHDFLPLGAVYLAWLLRDAPGAEYMKQVRENGLTAGFVSVTERKNVVEWLHNKTQTLSGLISVEREYSIH